MTNEELLKSISNMLKKHEDYLSENPDVFLGIQSRLLDAIGYGQSENLEKAKKSSRYSEWKPREDYSPEEQNKIDSLVAEGWSPREAERMASAYQGPSDFYSALTHTVHPSQPSDKMLEHMKDVALKYKQKAAKREGEQADPALNPQKYAAHKHAAAANEAYGNYEQDRAKFLEDLDKQDLHPLEYDDQLSQWEKEWHEKNPGAKDKMIEAAGAGKHFDEAKQARDERIKEGQMNLIAPGAVGEESPYGEYSDEAGGGGGEMDFQTAAQMAGGQKGEGGYEIGTVKDPAAIFREQNPDFVAHLKQKLQDKLNKNPEMKERHSTMPERERKPTVIRRRAADQPSPVKTLTPEEIKAQYGDKYSIKKPKGENQ